MHELISADFIHAATTADSREEILGTMCQRLLDAGRVKPGFRQAILDREVVFPTGLPVGRGVAIPHCDPEHVTEATVSIATLTRPIAWGEMAGEEGAQVDVETVFLLALTGNGHLKMLQRIMKAAQDPDFMMQLAQTSDPARIAELAQTRFTDVVSA